MNYLVIGEYWANIDPRLICAEHIKDINLRATYSSLEIWLNGRGWCYLDGVIWRTCFDVDFSSEYSILEMIEMSSVPCINSARSMLSWGPKISSLSRLYKSGMPVITCESRFGKYSKLLIEPEGLPKVLKIGNFHSGFGKALARSKEELSDMVDLSIVIDAYLSIEPYMKYERDIRCLIFGNTIRCFERKSFNWKSNVDAYEIREVEIPEEIVDCSLEVAKILNADIVGVDWIQLNSGSWIILEANLTPGLTLISTNQKNILLENQKRLINILNDKIGEMHDNSI